MVILCFLCSLSINIKYISICIWKIYIYSFGHNIYIYMYVCTIGILFTIFFFFLGLYLRNMDVPRLGVESELQLPALQLQPQQWDLNHICDLCHCSQQCWILNPLSEARDWTCILMGTSRVRYRWTTMGIPSTLLFLTKQ